MQVQPRLASPARSPAVITRCRQPDSRCKGAVDAISVY